ncbi:type II toxin-antitoxin system death-on-curing family toxin [Geodermatophilus sp. TF02-6]|uniref:type II toxin-antitoxin system death-on-curing family toxin n=1 Tax=Geodermatophilus sp. TF02-6 TaxID=2250575 RepID=UPI000DEBC0F2|nr:Fic family protein [Geodermatophilus sp. TF02-6]RBY76025.1 type II toxin-antitoxin system death-on-curing family toxin [Geodermatophilus sp. TF02-6]
MIYLDPGDLFRIAEAATGSAPAVRNAGLMVSSTSRPQRSESGRDAYPTLHDKAAALMHTLLRNRPLGAGNGQLAWAATAVFLDANGAPPGLTQRDAVDLVVAVADGTIDEVGVIAERLRGSDPAG